MPSSIARFRLALMAAILLFASSCKAHEGQDISLAATPLNAYNEQAKGPILFFELLEGVEVQTNDKNWTKPKRCQFFTIGKPTEQGHLRISELHCFDETGKTVFTSKGLGIVSATMDQIKQHELVKVTFPQEASLRLRPHPSFAPSENGNSRLHSSAASEAKQ